jgi:phage baseplate assembly protein V
MASSREHGVVIGIVSNRKDDEGLGRVKVKIPVYGNTETDWARVAVPFAGAAGEGHGFYWVPEQGDEVLVAFLHGDPKAPIIIGSLYSKKQKPPSAQPDERVLKTRNGHTILISDEAGKQRIEIRTKGGQEVTLDENAGAVRIKANQKVVLEAPKVDLGGEGGSQALVLGGKFMELFNKHTHTVGSPLTGPVTPPIPPPLVLSNVATLKG